MSLLHDQGIKYTSHVTRFADKLVENIDGLIKDTTHKKIIVYLQQDVSKMMHNSCDSPNIFMSKLRDVATQIRNTMVIQENIFIGSFKKDSQADSVPIALMTLTKSRETPLVIYNSLKLYSETRSKTAMDDLHALGLGISYQRVLDITKNLYDSQRRQK